MDCDSSLRSLPFLVFCPIVKSADSSCGDRMRITRRTSGGRGEYEVSEQYGAIGPSDMFGRQILIDVGEGIRINTGVQTKESGGKPRLRLVDPKGIQLPRQLAATLLMPRPQRTRGSLGRGKPILKSDRYAVENINLSSVAVQGGEAVLIQIHSIDLGNSDHSADTFQFGDRMAQVRYLWERAVELPVEIITLLNEHREMIESGDPIPPRGEAVVAELQAVLTEMGADFGIFRQGGEDVVGDLLRTLELAEVPPEPPIGVEEVDPEEVEIKRRTVREWRRWAASRGAASARFRNEVREAYGWSCLACGAHYPRTSFNRVAGVDGAHILPWADYDLDQTSNGLCLCRTHHWAFDEGLLTIRWSNRDERYHIDVPEEARSIIELEAPEFSIDELMAVSGPVPDDRLPTDHSSRPNSQYLKMLYDLYHRL